RDVPPGTLEPVGEYFPLFRGEVPDEILDRVVEDHRYVELPQVVFGEEAAQIVFLTVVPPDEEGNLRSLIPILLGDGLCLFGLFFAPCLGGGGLLIDNTLDRFLFLFRHGLGGDCGLSGCHLSLGGWGGLGPGYGRRVT